MAYSRSYQLPLNVTSIVRQIGFQNNVKQLSEFIISKKSLMVITGAGVSTSSGIPDYRGPNGSYKHGHKPVTYQQFVQEEKSRKRYWARSMTAWPIFSSALPSLPHITLAKLEKMGFIKNIITQNVDSLHHKAGSKRVLELHGALHEVICLNCKKIIPRSNFQIQLEKLNPDWIGSSSLKSTTNNLRADGDIDLKLTDPDYSTFKIPLCSCDSLEGGMPKPNVVLFGENCSPEVTRTSLQIINEADSLLVLGSSCTVYSVMRLINSAYQKKIPILIVNVGDTRADDLHLPKIAQPVGDILQEAISDLEKNLLYY